jgi:hypothetical protein
MWRAVADGERLEALNPFCGSGQGDLESGHPTHGRRRT